MAIKGITITNVSTPVLVAAFEVADSVATSSGRSAGGWVRLAKCQGSAEEPYVIAVRAVQTERKIQFSCSCGDFKFRKSKIPGACCKHMSRFFQESSNVPQQFWFYKAGQAFVLAVAASVVGQLEAKKLPIATVKVAA